MTVDIAALGIAVDATPVAKATTEMEKFTSAGDRLAASQEVIRRQTNAMQQAWDAHKKEQAAAGAVSADMEKIMLREAEAADKFMAALKRQSDAVGKTKADLAELRAAELGVAEGAAPMIAKMREAEDAVKQVGTATRKMGMEAKEDLRQFATALQAGDMGVAAQQALQFGQKMDILGTAARFAVSPLGLAASATAAFGIAAAMSAIEISKLEDSLKKTNGFAGLTAVGMDDMARSFGKSQGIISDTREAFMLLSQSGKFTDDTFILVGESAATMAKATGVSVETITKEFIKGEEGVTKLSLKFQDEYHMMDAATISHIRELEAQGEKQQAMNLLADTMQQESARRIEEEKAKLRGLAKEWDGVTDSAKNAWQEMTLSLSLMTGLASKGQEIKALQDQLSGKMSLGRASNTVGNAIANLFDPADAPGRGSKEYIEGRIAQIQKEMADEEAAARLRAKQQQIHRDGARAEAAHLDWMETKGDNSAKAMAIAAKKKQFLAMEAAGLNSAANKGVYADLDNGTVSGPGWDTAMKQIDQQYAPKKDPKGRAEPKERDDSDAAVRLLMQKNADALAMAQQHADQEQKLNDFARKAGLVADQQYYDAKRDIANTAAKLQVAAWEKDIQILSEKENRDKTAQDTTQRQIDQIYSKIKLKNDELEFEKKLADAQQVEAAEQAKYNALLEDEKRIKADLKTGTANVKTQVKNGSISDWDGLKKSDALYEKTVSDLTATRDEMQRAAATSPYDEKMQAKIAATTAEIERAKDMTGQYAATVDKFGEGTMSRFFNDTIMHTKSLGDAFKDMAMTFIAQLVKIEAAAAASNLMKSAGGLSGIIGSLGKVVASADGNVFSGGQVVHAFASGGAFTNGIVSEPTLFPMASGQTGLMGESGEEALSPLEGTPDASALQKLMRRPGIMLKPQMCN